MSKFSFTRRTSSEFKPLSYIISKLKYPSFKKKNLLFNVANFDFVYNKIHNTDIIRYTDNGLESLIQSKQKLQNRIRHLQQFSLTNISFRFSGCEIQTKRYQPPPCFIAKAGNSKIFLRPNTAPKLSRM